jgi:response regulator NasT
MSMARVLVIAESSTHAGVLRDGLHLAGHELAEVVGLDGSFEAAMERSCPEAIVLEARSPGGDLLDRVIDAMRDQPLPLVVFCEDSSEEGIERMVNAGAAACVVSGLKADRVPAIVQVALARFRFLVSLRGELGAAQQRLAERRFIERAKGLLMKSRNLSEDEAYHTLRRMAMERNRRMGDVARSVIEMADLLN